MSFFLNSFVIELVIFLWIFALLLLVVGFVLFRRYADADLTLLFYHYLKPLSDFRNKVVWITGASSGIGEHLAYAMVKSGARLALSGVKVERLTAVGERCKEISKHENKDILLVPFEISDFKVHDDCVEKVLNHFGQIDILVNNAGIGNFAKFTDIDPAADQRLFDVNVFGTINLTKRVLKHFLKRKKGHIVVTSSASAKFGTPYTSTYGGTKQALHGYFECLRSEMMDENLDITLVCPGPVVSKLNRKSNDKVEKKEISKQLSTNLRMSTERCCELMATAIAYKLDECWISLQPFLLAFYIAQYFPSKFKTTALMYIIRKYFKGMKKRLATRDEADLH